MKSLLATIVFAASINSFAGGDVPLPCLTTERATVTLKTGSVLDRGNNAVNLVAGVYTATVTSNCLEQPFVNISSTTPPRLLLRLLAVNPQTALLNCIGRSWSI